MKATARYVNTPAISLQEGLIMESGGGGFTVDTDPGRFQARRAASCLLEPAVGDRVLLSLSDRECFILAILTREAGDREEVRLTVPGDLTVAAPNGSVRIASGRETSLTSEKISLKAVEGQASFKTFSLISKIFSGQFERVKAAGRTVDNFFEKVVSRFYSNYRYVEEHEEVQAGSMRHLVDGTLTIQTENTVHTAEEHIKLDAEQIHLA